MQFKLTYSIQGMYVRRDSDLPVEILLDETDTIKIWMREIVRDEKAHRNLCVDLDTRQNAPKRITDTLHALRENRLLLDNPPQQGLPFPPFGEPDVDIEGRIRPNHGIHGSLLPRAARDWLSVLRSRMSSRIDGYIKAVRWHQAASGAHRPLAFINWNWSDDGMIWSYVPESWQVHTSYSRAIDVASPYLEAATTLYKHWGGEPFAHELIRESRSWTLRSTS